MSPFEDLVCAGMAAFGDVRSIEATRALIRTELRGKPKK